jgi:hypothetical protein
MIRDILLPIVAALIASELTGASRWLAIQLVPWAAKQIYATDAERASLRSEEWEALIRDDDSIPTNISKLVFALGLACAGMYRTVIRCIPGALEAAGRLADLVLNVLVVFGDDEIHGWLMCAWIVIGSTSMPWPDWLIGTVAYFALLFILVALEWLAAATAERIRMAIH